MNLNEVTKGILCHGAAVDLETAAEPNLGGTMVVVRSKSGADGHMRVLATTRQTTVTSLLLLHLLTDSGSMCITAKKGDK